MDAVWRAVIVVCAVTGALFGLLAVLAAWWVIREGRRERTRLAADAGSFRRDLDDARFRAELRELLQGAR